MREATGGKGRFSLIGRTILAAGIALAAAGGALAGIRFPGKLPLHNPPDRILVHQYGRESAYSPEDDEYRQLYERLRRVGGYRALDVVTGRDFVMFSMQTAGAEEASLEYYLRGGLVVAALYDTVQAVEHDDYRDLYYVLDYAHDETDDQSPPSIDPRKDCLLVYHPLDSPGKVSSVANIPYPKKAAAYVRELDLS